MRIAVRYYSKTGNAKKLAEAIADETSAKALPVSEPLTEYTDILFLCNSVYWVGVDGNVKKFIAENKEKIGKIVNVSTAALIESSYAQIKKLCEQSGISVSADEFHCKGSFQMMHKGKPDNHDIQAVKTFAKKIMG